MHINLRDRRIITAVIVLIVVALTVLILTGVLHGFLLTLFVWPGGIVVGNLIASAMWQPQWFLSLHSKVNKHHKSEYEQAERHHKEVLAQAEKHHIALKKHISDTLN